MTYHLIYLRIFRFMNSIWLFTIHVNKRLVHLKYTLKRHILMNKTLKLCSISSSGDTDTPVLDTNY